MAESVGHIIASHEDVLRGSSRVPAPLTSADHDVSGKKPRPITADFQIWEVDYRFQLQGNPTVASPKEQLYEQMTSNPALTERNIQKANAYLLDSRPEQKSLVTYHTLPSLYVCVWLVNTLTSTAPIGSPIICMWSPDDIFEQWERNLSLSSTMIETSEQAFVNYWCNLVLGFISADIYSIASWSLKVIYLLDHSWNSDFATDYF